MKKGLIYNLIVLITISLIKCRPIYQCAYCASCTVINKSFLSYKFEWANRFSPKSMILRISSLDVVYNERYKKVNLLGQSYFPLLPFPVGYNYLR